MFTALIDRKADNSQWQKIPWNDPEFSRRMLAEHLNQTHDHASRRQTIIDEHVEWIDRKILKGRPSKILDLGCGPGFYTSRFAARGCTCTGLDFSPASIAYAHEQNPDITYVLGNILELDYGQGYDLVMLIFGEFNAFSPQDAQRIIAKAYAALKPGGTLLLEVHSAEYVYQLGHQAPSWYTTEKGIFADLPYLCLSESHYEIDRAITHFYVYDIESGQMQPYTEMLLAYTNDEYRRLLSAFKYVLFYPSLAGSSEPADLFVIVAEK